MEISEKSKQYERMTATPIPKLVTSLSLPAVVNMLITTFYNLADTFFVSQLGTQAAAAVGVVFSLQSIIQSIAFGFAMGGQTLISLYLGEKKNDEADKVISSSMAGMLVIISIIFVLGLSYTNPLMRLLGASETVLPYAASYGRIIIIGAPFLGISVIISNCLKAQGLSLWSSIGMSCGAILNIILDPLFIFTFNMGIAGAAWATILSQLISCIVLIPMMFSKKSIVKFSFKKISLKLSTYGRIVSIGLPTFCRQGLGSLSSAVLNNQACIFGDAAVAGLSIAMKIYNIMRSALLGVGQGFQPVAGYNYGAGKKDRVKKALAFTIVLGMSFCLVIAIIIGLNAETIMKLFRSDDPEAIAIGAKTLMFMTFSLPILGYPTFVNQLYQCVGFSVRATFLASCRQGLFFIPFCIIASRYIGLTGLMATQAVSDTLFALISIPFHIYFYKKYLNN
ncbi:MAG: MATE family efflux transporter [Sphaerochaetaceae bacterium]|nr:MATE family efflux transporter [Sphaerochaetaceae bacterium]